MRFSTGKYVVEKKLAIGQTLYESKMRPKSSFPYVSLQTCIVESISAYISEILHDHRNRLVLEEPDKDQEHGLIEQCTHGDAVCEPLPEDVPPVPDSDILFHHLLILSIILEHHALLLVANTRLSLLSDSLPAWESAF